MKNSIYIVLALLAGLVVGNWSVQSDLRKARQEITGLKEQLDARGRRDNSLQNITSMLRVPDPVPETTTERPRRRPSRRSSTNEIAVAGATSSSTTNAVVANDAERKSMEEQIKTAVDLWKTRSTLARNGFLEKIAATPVQSQMFDQAITNMNQQLSQKIQQWTDYLKQQQRELTPETGVRMMNDLSGTVVSSYDELDRVLAPGWRDQAGPKFQLFDFINPEVALPLAEVGGKMNHRSPF
jgi:hypothetical protein